MKIKPLFTIFTPTYNREKFLKFAFDSIKNQKSYHLFEWLIIDDGSTDKTFDLVKEIKKKSKFKIRYYYQPNSGKHVAHNRAILKAKGELIIFLDSDDQILPGAINYLYKIWKSKSPIQKKAIAGFLAHCVNNKNQLIGENWPERLKQVHLHELIFNNLIIGEKIPIYRTDVLKKYPFPKSNQMFFEFIPEGVVWLEISKYYKVELLDKPMRYYHKNNEGLMIQNSKFITNLKGKILLNEQLENFIEKYFFINILLIFKILINKAVMLLLINKSVFSNIKKFSYIIKIFYIFLIPIAFIKFLYIKND
jgi:glycosyltransferase involved in cell wall biosynthesis